MFYWGFGFLMLAIAALVVGMAGLPGLGPLANLALLMALVFSVAGIVKGGRHHFHRHAHR